MKRISKTLESYKMVQTHGRKGLPINKEFDYRERKGQINGIKQGDLVEVVGYESPKKKRQGESVFTHTLLAMSNAQAYSKQEIESMKSMNLDTDSAPAWGRFTCKRVS